MGDNGKIVSLSEFAQENLTPSFGTDREKAQYLGSRATKQFVFEALADYEKNSREEIVLIVQELQRAGKSLQQLFMMLTAQGLQLEALVALMEKAVPGFRDNFTQQYTKTVAMKQFIDSLHGEGEHSAKPFKEKLDLCIDWNLNNDVKVKGAYIDLASNILGSPQDYEEEDVSKYIEMFDLSQELMTAFKARKTAVETQGPVGVEDVK